MKAGVFLTMSCRGEPGWSELHLSEWNGGVFTFPVYPDYSLFQNRMRNVAVFGQCTVSQKIKLWLNRDKSYLIITVDAIKTVEVGLVAVLVPPASHVGPGAVEPQSVWVLVPGWEWTPIMVPHRVTWQSNTATLQYELPVSYCIM